MNATKIITHNTDALARLLYQYQDSTKLKGLATALFGTQVQEIEDAVYQLLTRLDIDACEGGQLDMTGEIAGQAREGRADALYRVWIKAKIATNTSEGTAERLISLWGLFVPAASIIQLVESFPGEVTIYSNVPPDEVYEAEIVASMQAACGAGIKFGWARYFDIVNAFQFAGAAGGGGFGDLNNPNIGGQFSYII